MTPLIILNKTQRFIIGYNVSFFNYKYMIKGFIGILYFIIYGFIGILYFIIYGFIGILYFYYIWLYWYIVILLYMALFVYCIFIIYGFIGILYFIIYGFICIL
jgi:hypothetical protein